MLNHTPSPFSALPPSGQAYAQDIANQLGANPQMVALAIMGTINLASLGRFEILVRDDWTESSACFFVIGADSGKRKSPILKKVEGILFESIAEHFLPDQKEMRTRLAKIEHRKARLKELKRRSKKIPLGGPDTDIIEEMAALEEEIEQLRPPISPYISSGTPQALLKSLPERKGYTGVIDSEGGLLPGLKTTQEDQGISIMKAWSGDRIHNEQVITGLCANAAPHVSMLIMWQSKRLAKFLTDQRFIENGLVARFLPMFIPESSGMVVPYRGPSNKEAEQWYRRKINTMIASCSPMLLTSKRTTINLGVDALQALYSFQQMVEREKTVQHMSLNHDILEKAPSQAVRLSLILHLMDHDDPEKLPISQSHMEMGIALAQFFVNQHLSLRQSVATLPIRKNANRIMSRLPYDWYGPTPFKLQDIYKPLGMKADDCQQAIWLLQSVGYVRPYFDLLPPSDKKGRKESPRWIATMLPRDMMYFQE